MSSADLYFGLWCVGRGDFDFTREETNTFTSILTFGDLQFAAVTLKIVGIGRQTGPQVIYDLCDVLFLASWRTG